MSNTVKLGDNSPNDLFSKAGWIMINNYVQQEMMKPENEEWFDNSTFAEVLAKSLSSE
tara:strand:- start:97 stop:270 length:174 start_codon:yes stop_codon:yes gene_type:complete